MLPGSPSITLHGPNPPLPPKQPARPPRPPRPLLSRAWAHLLGALVLLVWGIAGIAMGATTDARAGGVLFVILGLLTFCSYGGPERDA